MAQEHIETLRLGGWQASYSPEGGADLAGEVPVKTVLPADYAAMRETHLRRVAKKLIERREALDEEISRAIGLAAKLDTLNAAEGTLFSERLEVCEELIAAIEHITRPYGVAMWRACVEDVLYAREERVIDSAIGVMRVIERGLRFDNLSKIIIERMGLH